MKKIAFLFVIITNCALAQKDYSSDVKSVDAIVAALYDVISGEPNTQRDWDRFRNLFRPEGRLIPTRKNEAGEFILKTLTPDEYISIFQSRTDKGFFEHELHRITETYGTIVHIFSTYENGEKKGAPAARRGINSIQLFYDNHRYYIVNIFWCIESMGFPLPEKYLK